MTLHLVFKGRIKIVPIKKTLIFFLYIQFFSGKFGEQLLPLVLSINNKQQTLLRRVEQGC